MTTRILPPDEWGRLQETGMAACAATLHPAVDEVIVIEEDGAIVGTWSFKIVPHVEGLWIADDHRGKSSVARKLFLAMRAHARSRGAEVVMTGAASNDVKELLAHVGAEPLPDQFLWYLTGKE